MEIKELIEQCHKMARDKGFWDKGRPNSECLMLIVTELAEACEADRHGDHNMLREELADTAIRLFDLCGWLNIDLEYEIDRKMRINKKRQYKHGKRY